MGSNNTVPLVAEIKCLCSLYSSLFPSALLFSMKRALTLAIPFNSHRGSDLLPCNCARPNTFLQLHCCLHKFSKLRLLRVSLLRNEPLLLFAVPGLQDLNSPIRLVWTWNDTVSFIHTAIEVSYHNSNTYKIIVLFCTSIQCTGFDIRQTSQLASYVSQLLDKIQGIHIEFP